MCERALGVLQGRATVDCRIKLREQRQDGVSGGTMRIVVDGFNAPVTAGNYIDLVQRGFYNGMEIQRSDGFVVQTGDPGPPVRALRPCRCWISEPLARSDELMHVLMMARSYISG